MPVEIAVLGVAAVAEVWPETVKGPGVGWQELTLGLESGVGVPVLGAEEETTEGLDAARVDKGGIGLSRAGEDRIVVG